ncbi:hypothetical protein [Marimonas arenosa]|uniref:Dihydroorotate dehydrogenase n=1 Tax=Marimonas arenosa TaxID=1795305 RepID=A0AAE3WFE1_9RHOB|nr:hypothetical protein [Marimonas arenosa]MDQ2092251.1 hypothetical protein [Marimonas arenosa]
MTDSDRNDEMELEAFFTAARQMPAPASEALMARVLGDALAVQTAAAGGFATERERPGFLAGLFSTLGGWPAVSGLATAAATGLWIGFSPSLGVGDAMVGALGVETAIEIYPVDYATGYEFAFEEGDAG